MMELGRVMLVCGAALLASPAVATTFPMFASPEAEASQSVSARGNSDLAAAIRRVLDEALLHRGIDREIATAIKRSYATNDFQPLWSFEGKASLQQLALRRRMDAAADLGLDPAAYAIPASTLSGPKDVAERAAADVAFSRTVALFVTHLASGRIRPADVSRLITLEPERPDIGKALVELSRTAGVALRLSRYEPQHRDYAALKAELARLRATSEGPVAAPIPTGPALKPGGSDARVPLLRRRLAVSGPSTDEVYDKALVAAVKEFQASQGLTGDGILGPRTLAALNGVSREADIEAISANLERWRWMPRDLGGFHVLVNVPEFTLRVVENGGVTHQTRAVVGAPEHPTPTFSHVMDHLVVNPFWHVPTSIVTNEMLPEIRRNPAGYFAKRGYQVLARNGGKMRVVDPSKIEWGMINPRTFRIRQAPGDANALGRIKFMFPNQHAVYLHDTPSKALFKKDYRAYSHGCVRVEEPLALAEVLLARAAPEWNAATIERLYGGPERRINLGTPVPVHLAYFTRSVDEAGNLLRFEDVYGYDEKMQTLPAF
jgi:L,D-transpeptidase YcbB